MKKLTLFFGSLIIVFTFANAQTWTQIGQDIDGEAEEDWSVSLNNDGSIVTIGATGNGPGADKVKVFQYLSGVWEQIESDINSEYPGDWFGHSVSISDDGLILAVGASVMSHVYLRVKVF